MPADTAPWVADEALLKLFANGDARAARILTTRLAPMVLRVAQRMLGDMTEAEDVTQEAMLRLWRQAVDWRYGEARVSTWLYRVTANLCTDRLRKRRRQALNDGTQPASGAVAPTALAGLQQKERLSALDAALQDLPDRQRYAVVLRHIEGLSNAEIAKVFGVGVEAVESLVARGKRALKAALDGRRDELGYQDD